MPPPAAQLAPDDKPLQLQHLVPLSDSPTSSLCLMIVHEDDVASSPTLIITHPAYIHEVTSTHFPKHMQH